MRGYLDDDVQLVQIVDYYPEPGTPDGDLYYTVRAWVIFFMIVFYIIGELFFT